MTALSLPRPRRIRPLAILVTSAILVVGTQVASVLMQGPSAPDDRSGSVPGVLTPVDAPTTVAAGSLEQIDRSIGIWTRNLAAEERDFLSAASLGVLYEARARLSGDVADYGRAIEASERSLAVEPTQLDVQALHARLQLATHEFTKAVAEARMVDRAVPDQPAVLSIIADASLELGDVDTAAEIYTRLGTLAPGAALSARLARLAFLQGDPAGAVTMAESAHAAAITEGTTGPGLSWYAYLAGTLSLASGAPEAAAAWFDQAIDAWPGSFLALAGRARAAAALGATDAAIDGYQAAIAIAPQPDALTALGDLLAQRGDTAAADDAYATVRAIASLQGSDGLIFNRQLVLFDVNHDRDVASALTLAEHELAERKDVYGYDAYAWALLANGRAADADAAMTSALALGTREALLLYHAAEIKLALGDRLTARTYLEAALGIRGALDPLAASRAAATLESLR
jgi:tetratricopeptide (TPR) repeat protein